MWLPMNVCQDKFLKKEPGYKQGIVTLYEVVADTDLRGI